MGVLLADGSVPKPAYFDGSSSTGHDVAHWSVYDGGSWPERPRAAALHAECSCGWTGDRHTVDWPGLADLRSARPASGTPTAAWTTGTATSPTSPAAPSRSQEPEQVPAALGLNVDQTRSLLARFGRWSPYP
ncbi:hypothetical protein [Streptomyces sp. NPDC088762]|uniref:hypothetical protein n=1 Tax=Streptomyces sp. NPDC088762 TaxID=3365891 RepID=UPI0038069110